MVWYPHLHPLLPMMANPFSVFFLPFFSYNPSVSPFVYYPLPFFFFFGAEPIVHFV